MKLLSIALVLALCSIHQSAYATTSSHCTDKASSACYFTFNPGGSSKKMHFYASLLPQDHDMPRHALLVIHGYARDAKTLFNTTLLVVKHAHALHDTLVVAPVFHVVPSAASKCQTSGVPRAQSDDVQWTCRSWLIGSSANNDPHISAFTATDALLNALKIRWPSLQTVTIAGFSAGAQMVQHYIGFAAPAPTLALHYVVSNPGIWLYFDPQRPQPLRQGKRVDWSSCASGVNGLNHCQIALTTPTATCPNYNRWPYGTEQLPARLHRNAADARAHYVTANISYLESALDNDATAGMHYRQLNKSCAAKQQGPYRLQRGIAYAEYDRGVLAPTQQRRIVIIPGCAHDVACVFSSALARPLLLGNNYSASATKA